MRRWRKDRVDPDMLPPDWTSLASLMFGIIGLMLKSRYCAWIALYCCLSAFLNVKMSEVDMKQLFCSVTFSIMGLLMCYSPHAVRASR